ncbi:hypothetical protein AB0M23_30910 [Streptomyces sp. NPDC052077]|uniref:hypothetical protein n=1 Tax=Streptomyces sp. NPDC052077 TaxID=3154757 RepID=UPI00344955FB
MPPSLPPPVWAELYYGGAWHDITDDLRAVSAPVTVTRGLSSESAAEAEPTTCTCDLDSRDDRYAPRNPMSPLYGLIGRNTPFRWGYTVGSAWARLPGADSNRLTLPGSTALAVGDLDLRVEVALDNWEAPSQGLAARYLSTGDQRSWALAIGGTGQLILYWSPDGTLASRRAEFSPEGVKAYRGQRIAVRVTLDVDNGRGGYELRFYTGRTVDDEEWHLLGTPLTGPAPTAVHPGTADLEAGAVTGLAVPPTSGALYGLRLLDGIGGRTVAYLRTADGAPGAASFTSGGGVWTVRSGTVLTNRHVRMAGEVPAWPPTRDLSGADNIVSIAPTGITRRLDAGNKPQDSALRRYIRSRGPVECWPLTDGPDSKAARSLISSRTLRQVPQAGATPPVWAAGRLADWVEPVLSAQAETYGGLQGNTPRLATTGANWSVDLFLSGGGRPSSGQFTIYDTGAGTDADNRTLLRMVFSGNLDQITLLRVSEGSDASSVALLSNIIGLGIYDERPHHLRLTVEPGATSTWYLYIDGAIKQIGSIPGIRVKPVGRILLGWGYATIAGATMTDRSFGYLTYWTSSGPSAAQMWRAYLGFQEESAGSRIERLAGEAGFTASVAGETVYQQRMGIQDQARLLELLNEAAATNFGYLLDARDSAGVIHRGGSTLWNQGPALTLDYSAGLIAPPFRPVDDDKLTENDVTVARQYGAVPARQVLTTGELSVQDPPNGVGRYDQEYRYSLATDQQADHVAHMRLHLGTYPGVRYTRLTLNLANERVFAMIDDILRVDVGDLIRLTSLPADHGPDPVDVLVQGYEETAGPDGWTITFVCAPGAPWRALVADSRAYGLVDTDGSRLAAPAAAADTVLAVTTTGQRRWTTDPIDMPFDIRAGGEVMRVTAAASAVQDGFARTVTAGWGTATSGQTWTTTGGSSSDYSVQEV